MTYQFYNGFSCTRLVVRLWINGRWQVGAVCGVMPSLGIWSVYSGGLDLVPFSEPFISHHPLFDRAVVFFNYLAFILGLAAFILCLAYLTLARYFARAIAAFAIWFAFSETYEYNPCIKLGIIPLGAPPANTFNGSKRLFHSSALVQENLEVLRKGQPIPHNSGGWYATIDSIFSSDFFEQLEALLRSVANPENIKEVYSVRIEANLSNGLRRNVGKSFRVTPGNFDMETIITDFTPIIDNFLEQSATGEGISVLSTRVVVYNLTDLPDQTTMPFTSSAANVEAIRKSKLVQKSATKAASRTTATSSQILEGLNKLEGNLANTMTTSNQALLEALKDLKASPALAPQPAPSTDWTPLITAIAAVFSIMPIIVEYLQCRI